MAKLDGVSKELYPGEAEGVFRDMERRRRAAERTNFRISNERMVERKAASGYKIVYKNIGGFRG
jgi:hypothetical protein